MLNEEDEEYRKRKERAKQLRSIVNVNNETDTDYAAKKERAKELRNFAGMTTYNDKLADKERIKQKMDELWNENSNQTIAQEKVTQNEEIKKEKNLGDKIGFVAKSTGIGALNGTAGIAQSGITEVANNLEKGSKKSFSENAINFANSILNVVNPLSSTNDATKNIPNYVKNTINIITDKTKNPLQKLVSIVLNANNESIENTSIKQLFNSGIQLAGTANPNASNEVMQLNNKISEPIGSLNQNLANESQEYGSITRLLGTVGQQVGNMFPSIAISAITKNPTAGLAVMGISAKGQSTQEALKKGVDLNEAVKIGNAKGIIEIGTEMMTGGVNIFGKGALDNIVQRGIINKVENNVAKFFVKQGVDAGGEVLEETVSDILDTLIDKGTVDPNADYSLKDWSDTAITTVLTTLVLNTITGGLANDIREIKVEDNAKNNVEPSIFYTSKFNQDGTIADIEAVAGKPIQNINKKVNLNPAIVKNRNADSYSVIDSNTGLVLDSSPYETLIAAEQGFNHRIINLSDSAIKGINSKVAKSNIALQNKIMEVANKAEQQLNSMPQKSTEQPQNSNLDNETTNYVGNVENGQNIENNKNLNMEDRTYENVSNKNVQPYSEEHPELSQDIKDMAANFMEDLSNTLPGERYKTGDTWTGQKRSTTKELADFKDATGVSWDKIGNILNDIYEGNGNYALAKKMEIVLDKALTEGYKNIYGQTIMPNESYLDKKEKIEGKSYRKIDKIEDTDYDNIDLDIFSMKKKISSKKYDNVDINNKRDYNKYNSKLTIKEKNQIISEVRTWKTNQKDGTHYIDLSAYGYKSYIYNKKGNDIIPIKRVEGSQEYLNMVRKGIENGTYRKSKTINQWLATVKNQTKNNRSNNVSLSNRESNKNNVGLSSETTGEPKGSNRRNVIKENSRNRLENSNANESSFSMGKDSLGRKLIKNNTNPTDSPDIRYLKRKDANINQEKTLIAQHNTSEEKLLEALNLGALPVPSIAVTKYQNPIAKYGDITLLFNKDAINPTDKRNVIYDSDIYSTRKPETGNILDKEKIKSFEKLATDKGISYGYLNMIEDYLEQNEFKRAKDIIQNELQRANENIDMQLVEDVYAKALESIKEKRVMKPGVDPYTSSGNRKNIAQMSLPYTLDNIVEIMTKKNTKGSESNSFAGPAEVRANLSQKFKSIQEIHAKENSLITSQEMDNLKEEINNKFYDIIDKISKYDNINRYFGSSESVANALNETAKFKNITKEVLDNELDYVSIKGVPENVLQEAVDFLNSLKDVPTEYFEAKPQRAVGFDEVEKAIVPTNTSKEIIDKLNEKGVKIEYYNTQEERNNLISNSNEVRFLKKDTYTNTKSNIIDNLMDDIIQKSKDNFESDIKINSNIVDKEALLPLNYSKLKQSTLYNLAKKLFNNIHRRTFKNNNENIHVTNSDIDESIAQTLKNPNQKALLKENIAVFSQLDKIIENGIEIQSSNQPISDNKMRKQYSDYKYYYANVYIDGAPSIVQFDTRVQKGTTGKDERHFRLERIYKINEVDSNGGTDKSIIHFSNESTSTTSIPQNPENVNNSKKTSDIEAGQRNAERTDAYIEQEIKKIEATGEWDDSIPVTKMTDIRKSIEDYLGIGVQKGHFRQRAYAIYNTKNGSIRTKEFKDMDSILHEVGHAIDLGNKISVDKESIANELLAAINKYGGYEGYPRSILLDEGFAEVIREYAIIPEQAKSEYPQSVAVLEGIRANDESFDKFISNIQQQIYNYIHQSPQNRVMSNLSIGEQTDRVPLTKKTLKEKIVKLVWDKDYALKAAVEELSNGKKLDPSQNAYILTRLASGVNDKAISIITNGYIDLEGNKTFGGLGKLGDILGNDEQRFNDLRAYLVAQRDLEYKAKTLKTGIRTMDSKAVVDKFKNDTQIQRAAKVVYDTLDGVLQYAVDNGLITRADADILRQDNAFYVPFQRVIENNGNQVGKRGEVKNIIKRRTGSELDVKDVLENIVVNSVNIIKQVENNNILRALYKEGESAGIMNNIFEKIPAPMKKIGTENLAIWEKELKNQGIDTDNIDLEKTIDIFLPDNKTDVGNRITSFIDEDGKRVYLQFSKDATDIFNTVMNLDSQTMSKVLKLNSVLNMPLRYGATMANIGFAIPNMISDTAQAMIYSEAGFIPVVDNALGVLDILTATNKSVAKFMNKVAPEYAKRIDALYTMYEQSGATSSTRMSQYRKSTQEIMRDVYGTKNSEILGIKESFKPLKRLLDLMTYIPEISEQSTRFRVFEKSYSNSIAKGSTELNARIKAAIESRDATQDFGRTGNLTREINQIIPFSAARVGSAYTFTEKVKANPKATSMRIAILTAIAMGIQAIGYDDKEIEELNQRKKDDNFVLKIGDKVITIKKPQGILRSIVNLAEYIQDLATGHIEEGKEGERLGEWLRNAIMDNMPADEITGLVPNAVAPLIENAINKDFYYNTEIVKSYDLNLPDEEQYYDYNSQLAILLGKAFNKSPAKIDNLISGYLGGLGTQFTNIIDYVSGKLGISAEKPDMGIEQNSVGKRFVVNVNTNSASIDEVYTRRDELTKKLNGGTITADEEKELDKIKDAIKNLSNINKQIKAIKQDLTMSGKEKAEKIRPLQEQKTDTARQALGKELINSNNTSKIESTKFYPSNSTLKNNGYTLTLTEEMKKEYENLAYEKYKQYKQQGLYSDEYLEKLETTCKEYAKKSLMQKYRNKLVKSK